MPRGLALFLVFSSALHLGAGTWLLQSPERENKSDQEALFISYVESGPAVREIPRATPQIQKPLTLVRTSSELLADPRQGRAFIPYFGLVKEKIAGSIQSKKRLFSEEKVGEVTLGFVLDSKGHLEKSWVIQSSAPETSGLQNFALEALKSSAPFPRFPKALGYDSIAFLVTLSF